MNEMYNFFNIENRIGVKKLSNADLGISGTSNQTHIGLFNDVLTFLGDKTSTTAMLIHDSYCQILDCFFDRIENPDGSYRSPKIRMGSGESISVVAQIRKFAKEQPNNEWYLLWSSLENKDLVFWLISKSSNDFNIIKNIVEDKAHVITEQDIAFQPLKEAIVKKINYVSVGLQKEIEIISQVGNTSRKFKTFDIEKASKQFSIIGKKGEELINEYLEHQKIAQRIRSFDWMNKSRETGLPYDFVIYPEDDKKQFVDVKSTRFDFAQNIVFSSQEVFFANNYIVEANQYAVYRVFNLDDKSGMLSICNNCMDYMNKLDNYIEKFKTTINSNRTELLKMSLAVSPEDCFAYINEPIQLH